MYDSDVYGLEFNQKTVEVPHPSRTCAVSRRDFRPNEPFFSVLTGETGFFVRKDIAAEHWQGPPERCIGWWQSTVKHVSDSVSQRVSCETLQTLFERMNERFSAGLPCEADTLYILTLLLLRRKLLRYEKEITDGQGNRFIEVYALQTDITYQVPVVMPSPDRLESIQEQLAALTAS